MDKAPPDKTGSEKKLSTIEAHPPLHKIRNYFGKKNALGCHHTNRRLTLISNPPLITNDALPIAPFADPCNTRVITVGIDDVLSLVYM